MARLGGAIYGLLVLALSQYAAAQTVHVVGHNTGWVVPQDDAVACTNWVRGNTFSVGDILIFNFATNEQDVVRVLRESFNECSESNGIGDIITTSPVNITLGAAGDHYYICTVGRHSDAGQKLAITVTGTPGASPPPATPQGPKTKGRMVSGGSRPGRPHRRPPLPLYPTLPPPRRPGSSPHICNSIAQGKRTPVLEENAKQGDVIKSGTIIRLQHMRTRKWLHSHLHASPISRNLEVSCFGGESESDTGDYWR